MIYVKVFVTYFLIHVTSIRTRWETSVQSPDYLAQMANLIRRNPSITVERLPVNYSLLIISQSITGWTSITSTALMISSVWCSQTGAPLPTAWRLSEGSAQRYLARAPLFSWNPKEKDPVGEWCFLDDHPNPRGLYAVQVGDQSFSPWLMQGDVLIIQGTSGETSCWVLLAGAGKYHLGLRISDGSIIDPRTGQRVPRDCEAVGVILRQERIFSHSPK